MTRSIAMAIVLLTCALSAFAQSGSYSLSATSALEFDAATGTVTGTAVGTEPFYLERGAEYVVCVSGSATYLDGALPVGEVLFFYGESGPSGERIRMRSAEAGECFTFRTLSSFPEGEPKIWMFLVDQLSGDNQGGFVVTVTPTTVPTSSDSWGQLKVEFGATEQSKSQ